MAPLGGVGAVHPDVVRVAGLEPALLSEQDFESSASTNSTTPAQVWEARNLAAEFAGSIVDFSGRNGASLFVARETNSRAGRLVGRSF